MDFGSGLVPAASSSQFLAPDFRSVAGEAARLYGADALRAGIADGEIGVRYQPVVRLFDRRPVMVEALARWHRPGAAISPEHFVPVAEQAGLVRELSGIVAAAAVADLGALWPRLR